MADDDEQTGDLFICALPPRTPEALEQWRIEQREVELAAYRARRAKRIAELGLGSHRKDP